MLTALDASDDAFDDGERNFVSNIREHGWFRTNVFAEAEFPGFSYTTGFWVSLRRPEIITFSLRSETTHDIYWDIFRDARGGIEIPIGRRTNEIFANNPAYVFLVAKKRYPEYLGWSRWFYGGDDFPCLQLVWPDRAGLFPWDSGADEAFLSSQPDLTEDGWLASLAD